MFQEHLRRHTGETPFHCTDCPLRFKTRNTYKRHLKTRHGKLLTANGIRFMPREEFLKICSRAYPRGQEDSDFDEEDEVDEEEEVEDVGGTTIPAPPSPGVELGEEEGDGEEGEDPAEFPQGCVDEGGSPVSVEEVMSASNKLLELCSQVVKQEAGWPDPSLFTLSPRTSKTLHPFYPNVRTILEFSQKLKVLVLSSHLISQSDSDFFTVGYKDRACDFVYIEQIDDDMLSY